MSDFSVTEVCPRCDGQGTVYLKKEGKPVEQCCPRCNGKGSITIEKQHSYHNPTELRK